VVAFLVGERAVAFHLALYRSAIGTCVIFVLILPDALVKVVISSEWHGCQETRAREKTTAVLLVVGVVVVDPIVDALKTVLNVVNMRVVRGDRPDDKPILIAEHTIVAFDLCDNVVGAFQPAGGVFDRLAAFLVGHKVGVVVKKLRCDIRLNHAIRERL